MSATKGKHLPATGVRIACDCHERDVAEYLQADVHSLQNAGTSAMGLYLQRLLVQPLHSPIGERCVHSHAFIPSPVHLPRLLKGTNQNCPTPLVLCLKAFEQAQNHELNQKKWYKSPLLCSLVLNEKDSNKMYQFLCLVPAIVLKAITFVVERRLHVGACAVHRMVQS